MKGKDLHEADESQNEREMKGKDLHRACQGLSNKVCKLKTY